MLGSLIKVRLSPDVAILSVNGRGTFEFSEAIKAFCIQALDKGVKTIVFDLSQCSGMDSTFMGILTMISRVARPRKASVELRSANESTIKNLFSLGLKPFFTFTTAAPATAVDLEATSILDHGELDSQTRHRNILDAHQALVDADARNAAEFQDLLDFLKEQKP